MKRLNGAGTRALATVRQFTLAQRTIALIGVAVLLLGGIALANQLAKPSYAPLYSGLSSSDASAVVAQLQKDKVDYQLADGGTILVPKDAVNAERLATASMLTAGAGGYSLLDGLGVTASQFQQDVTYKRAIEGELAKTIGSIDGVTKASVQLAVPKQTVFSDDEQKPTASVFVEVAQPLSSDQVGAVVHLVAAAYPGLTDANVSVVDQRGDTLSAVGGASGSAAEQASDYESATRQKVQAMLDKTLGPGNATVTVAADVSRSSGTKRSEQYTSPTEAPVLSESVNDQSYSGAGAGAAAASGVLGNDTTSTGTSGTATGGTTGSGNTFTSKQGVKNNAVNKEVTDETIVPGTLNRQTIAVALNSAVPAAISTTELQTLVAAAAGVDPKRGDTVSVTQLAFSTAAQKQAAAALKESQAAASGEQMTAIITTAIQVVGGIALFLLVVGLLRKLFKRQDPVAGDAGVLGVVPAGPAGGVLPAGAPTVQLGSLGAGAPGGYGLPAGAAPTQVLPAADPAYAQMQADVDALAGADPEQTAEYLRALMGDRARA